MKKTKVVVAGLGEVGKPLFDLLSTEHDVIGVDISPPERIEQADVLHVCFPFQIKRFHWRNRQVHRPVQAGSDGHQQHRGDRYDASHRRTNRRRGSQQPGPRQARPHARGTESVYQVCGSDRSRDGRTGRQALRVRRPQNEGSLVAGGHRTGEAHGNDVFRPDDCLGAGSRTLLRPGRPKLPGSCFVLR